MPETQQQIPEQEQPGKQARASTQNPSEVPKTPEYDPDQLQRSFGLVNQESDHFKRECVMHQQAQVKGMTIEEYRHWYKLRQWRSKRFYRLTQPALSLWQWTGFGEKKLWDILQLLIVPVVLAGGAFYLQESAKQKDQQLADDRTKQESLNRYFDSMTALLFDRKLRTSKPGDEVRTIARAKTLTTLDGLTTNLPSGEKSYDNRQMLLLQFLQETQLIRKDRVIVSLKGADFTRGSFFMADFHDANLSETFFGSGSDLNRANLSGTNLTKAFFFDADLSETNLSRSDLSGAIIVKTDLSKASLRDANLSKAKLSASNFRDADLSGANLSEAQLADANLQGARVTVTQLDQAKLCHTTLSDGKISDRDCKKLSK